MLPAICCYLGPLSKLPGDAACHLLLPGVTCESMRPAILIAASDPDACVVQEAAAADARLREDSGWRPRRGGGHAAPRGRRRRRCRRAAVQRAQVCPVFSTDLSSANLSRAALRVTCMFSLREFSSAALTALSSCHPMCIACMRIAVFEPRLTAEFTPALPHHTGRCEQCGTALRRGKRPIAQPAADFLLHQKLRRCCSFRSQARTGDAG